jgi:uncharacterized membrane protein
MPLWVLALSYWLHLLATILWVGGLALMALVVWPSARAVLGPSPQLAELMRVLHKRFAPLGWFSLALLTATGLTQMTAHPNYHGVLQFTNAWARAILFKHLVIVGMMGIGLYMHLSLQPALARLALLEAKGKSTPEAATLQTRELWLTRLNLACGVVVLALTAVARVL